MKSVEISLFPIPGCVSLPYTKKAFHVFEPRYRQMISDSIQAGRRIGVAHTQKVISEPKQNSNLTTQEILKSNQKTYLPYPVFAAGFVEIIETLDDGRLLVEISMDQRFQIKEDKQLVPYRVVICEPFEDDLNDTFDEDLRSSLDQILLEIANGTSKDISLYLKSKDWLEQSYEEYSFKIYTLIEFEPDVLQRVIELKTATERIEFLKDSLTRGMLN